jgi:tRNA A-37 threonylcarbamoyl transferase component Bud32/tetratricopeptide (TPR) repeat protein
MPLANGTRLGPYEILGVVGAGGMGEVYKARDTRLDRIVAIKTSHEKFSDRFEREAKVVAALNHPHICTLYDVGPDYLVMEYIDGRPLRGPPPLAEVLRLALQIADALDAAHKKGIVHRDPKPGNILVTNDGRVKVLDFGLAQMAPSAVADSDATRTIALTQAGTAVGTVAYMSPEQARGQVVDARSDIWSFGVVLYELVAGVRPFEGDTAAVIFAALLHKTPAPVRERNPGVPAELEAIIAKALEKDRELRYQSAADLRADLKRLERTSGAVPAEALVGKPRWKGWIAVAAAVVVVAGGLFFWQRAHVKPLLTDKDVLVLADFTNTTSDPVFDGTLREALAVALEQSPFLSIMGADEMRQGLRLMGRAPGEKITNEVAREICQRENEKATIGGSIASLGRSYVVTLQAANCRSGEVLAREQTEAEDKEHVLKAVSAAASAMRAKLGESLGSIRKLDRPLEQVTTSSLEALQSMALGAAEARKGSQLAEIPFFKRATELDTNFAMAWQALGGAYRAAGDLEKGAEYERKAYGLVDRVTERARKAGYKRHLSLASHR